VPQAKQVTLQTHGKDKYGRTLGDVFLLDGTNVNHTLVKDGWCWWYRKYAPLDAELEKLEKDGREARTGLWVDPSPIPPWVYRKSRRGQSLDLLDLVPLEGEPERSGATRGLHPRDITHKPAERINPH
jgi:micrococcal nuclease